MRTLLVLALLLAVAAPPGVWHAGAESSPGKGAAPAMGSPAGALCQLVRDSAKADKSFSNGWLPAPDSCSCVPLVIECAHRIAHASPLRAIALDVPPLAPRPPPFA